MTNDKLQWSKIKDGSLKEKLDYIFTYYRWHIFGVVFGCILIVSLTLGLLSNRYPIILAGEIYTQNLTDNQPKAFTEALCEKLGLNAKRNRVSLSGSYLPDSEEVNADTEYAAKTRLLVKVSAKSIDFWAAEESQFMNYIHPEDPENNFCAALTTVLSAETIEALRQMGRLRTVTLDGEEIPYFIDIGSSGLSEMMGITTDECLISFIVTSSHADAFRAMIDLLINN